MKRCINAMVPSPNESRLNEAIQSVVRLYQAGRRLDQAAEWKNGLQP
jgi:hypothetical protein